jgi:outer membrane receptor protein involved in Fe transport
VIEATAQVRTSFANAAGARNFGVELEARKAVGRHLLAGANYTYVSSEIELTRGAAQVQTTLVRPLSGQSSHVVNAFLEVRSGDGLSGRVLVNWFDERISDVGAYGIPDIYEEGRLVVDAVVGKRFGAYSLRLSGDNLTDSANEFTQGGQPQRTFRTGRSLSLSLSYSR